MDFLFNHGSPSSIQAPVIQDVRMSRQQIVIEVTLTIYLKVTGKGPKTPYQDRNSILTEDAQKNHHHVLASCIDVLKSHLDSTEIDT